MNDLKIFEHPNFGKVRTVEINGNPWLVGKDVAAALGYERPTKAIQDHVDEEDRDVIPIQDSIDRMQNTPIINESGLYSLVLSSKLPEAKKFKRWVTSEVLPSIRKHRAYMTSDVVDQIIADPDTFIKIVTELKVERENRQRLEAKVETDRPKVEFAETVRKSDNLITVDKFAKLLYDKHGIKYGRNSMFKLLRDKGFLNSDNIPYQKYMDQGWFVPCEVMRYGKPHIVTFITGKGQVKLFESICKLDKT